MLREIVPAVRMALAMTVLTGLLYPGLITAMCQALFPRQANGGLIERDGRVIGSSLIGQSFMRPEYFHPRPSAAGNGYDASLSGGSNLGPASRKLAGRVKASVAEFRAGNPGYTGPVPVDIVTASGSGLDPHISPAAARAQAARVAKARGAAANRVTALIDRFTSQPALGFIGDPAVHVLELNLALDRELPVRR
jgi:K+-transporting ATPase ATPase C chain